MCVSLAPWSVRQYLETAVLIEGGRPILQILSLTWDTQRTRSTSSNSNTMLYIGMLYSPIVDLRFRATVPLNTTLLTSTYLIVLGK